MYVTCELFVNCIYRMPYTIRKLPNKSRYRVYNTKTKRIYSRSTTRKKAMKQLALLKTLP
jgi:hypothetical protein